MSDAPADVDEVIARARDERSAIGILPRELKVRAARAGMSLSDFLNAELERVATHRQLDELVAEIGPEPSLRQGEAAAAVRAGRRR